MRETLRDYAALPLRLVLGFGFIYHGFPKLFTAEGHQGIEGMLANIGIPAPGVTSWVVGGVEVLGGLALLLGAFVSVASVALAIEMIGALFTVHLPYGFNFINIIGMTDSGPQFGMPGYEVNLLYIAGLVTLIFLGAGAASLERMSARERAVREVTRQMDEEVGTAC